MGHTETDAKELFAEARKIDSKMVVRAADWKRLLKKQVKTEKYDPDVWFKNMADEVPSLFRSFPVPVLGGTKAKPVELQPGTDKLINALKGWRSKQKFRIRTGKKRTLKYATMPEIVKYWSNPRAIVTTTDLHIRETPIAKVIDVKALSDFNLLPLMPEDTSSLEMMSLVLSSAGALTDSHSDDLDVSNYCFCGKKLWLAWDTQEGFKHGLDDCDRVAIRDQARFNMDTFLSLKSSRWMVVEDGDCLYLPGGMAHRVVTLRPYIGVGSFYVSFPNALRTVSRWQQFTANWELDRPEDSEDTPTREEVAASVAKALKSGPQRIRKSAGAEYSNYALSSWSKSYSASKRKQLTSAAHIADAYQHV